MDFRYKILKCKCQIRTSNCIEGKFSSKPDEILILGL